MTPRTYGRSRDEIRSRTIAHHLVISIEEIETYFGDPFNILLDAEMLAGDRRGGEIKRIVQHLKSYYRKES